MLQVVGDVGLVARAAKDDLPHKVGRLETSGQVERIVRTLEEPAGGNFDKLWRARGVDVVKGDEGGSKAQERT